MKTRLIIMPLLFRGGSEKQIRYVIEEISNRQLPLVVIVESSDPKTKAEELEFQNKNPSTCFILLNTEAINAKFSGIIKRYTKKFLSLKIMIGAIKKCAENNEISTVMVTNLTGLVLLPFFKKLNCEMIYNERNPGVKICNNIFKRELLRKCKKIVCNSKYASTYMSNRLRRPVEVINNGIKNINIPLKKMDKNGDLIIIVPARISRIKNQKIVLEAINLLKNIVSIKVLFAGAIEDEIYYLELKKFCNNKELNSRVEFLGFTSCIFEYYSKSDLLILPSFEEGTPNVILEAFMCKIKVLASDIPMNIDCLQDKRFLFSPSNAEELAEKIQMIYKSNEQDINEIIQKNHQFVIDNYSIKIMGNRYIDLLYK